jgi:hypothetical protein
LLSKNVKITTYKTKILYVFLYGRETWYLTLREEHRLRVFENRVLKGMFGPKRDEVTGEWRKLHNEELRDLSSPSIITIIKSRRMACRTNRGEEERIQVIGGKARRKETVRNTKT